MHHKVCRLVLFIVVLSPSLTRAQGPDRTQSTPKIHVVIIGVPVWHLKDYEHSNLSEGITDACREIVTFFQNRFTPDQVQFHPSARDVCSEKLTTYSSITHLLKVELPSFGTRTLTFVFMLSHGEIVRYDNKLNPEDLRFVPSDATDQNIDDTSILIGRDLLSWLNQMPAGSTVLAFVDTCNAGAVDSPKLQVDVLRQRLYGLRFGLVAASMSQEKTYNANFTRALIQYWQTHPCPDGFENWIQSYIAKHTTLTDLKNFEGYPKIIVPYADVGNWCLNALGSSGKLLFLYQGAIDPVQWTISRAEQGDDFPEPRTTFVANTSFALELVPPGHYTVTARDKDNQVVHFGPFDLATNATAPVFLTAPKNPKEVTEAFMRWRDHAAYKGVPQHELNVIDKGVQMARAIENNEPPISCIVEGPCNETERGPDPSNPGNLIPQLIGNPEALRKVGIFALREHDLSNASKAFAQAASAAADDRFRHDTATAAYIIACAAGETDVAKQIQNQFRLGNEGLYSELNHALQSALNDKTPQSIQKLKAVGTTRLLTDQLSLIVEGIPKGLN
jgi:hypothetical protein